MHRYRKNSIESFSIKIENNFPVLVHGQNSDKIQNHHIEEIYYLSYPRGDPHAWEGLLRPLGLNHEPGDGPWPGGCFRDFWSPPEIHGPAEGHSAVDGRGPPTAWKDTGPPTNPLYLTSKTYGKRGFGVLGVLILNERALIDHGQE